MIYNLHHNVMEEISEINSGLYHEIDELFIKKLINKNDIKNLIKSNDMESITSSDNFEALSQRDKKFD